MTPAFGQCFGFPPKRQACVCTTLLSDPLRPLKTYKLLLGQGGGAQMTSRHETYGVNHTTAFPSNLLGYSRTHSSIQKENMKQKRATDKTNYVENVFINLNCIITLSKECIRLLN